MDQNQDTIIQGTKNQEIKQSRNQQARKTKQTKRETLKPRNQETVFFPSKGTPSTPQHTFCFVA